MNILELCLSDGSGGLELYAAKVVRWLHDHGHRCRAVVRPDALLARRLGAAGISYTPMRNRNRVLPWRAARRLARLIETHEIDVLHMHWGKDLPLATLAKRLSRRPVRLVYSRQMALTRPKRDLYHRWLYGAVDRYVTISRRLRDDAQRFLPMPADQIQLLYYGVAAAPPHDDAVCAQFLNQAGMLASDFKIGLFGRIERGKGQHVLVSAVAELIRRGHAAQAALVGHVMDQDYFDGLTRQIASAGLSERVRYLGFHDNPPAVMGCFDVVVLASEAETFGLVLIEAMRAGTAVIGTDAGGVPEIITHEQTGLLVPPGDAGALADALQRLIIEPGLRERLAAAGKADADARFSEEAHFRDLLTSFGAPV